jgi:hypothetical protein
MVTKRSSEQKNLDIMSPLNSLDEAKIYKVIKTKHIIIKMIEFTEPIINDNTPFFHTIRELQPEF